MAYRYLINMTKKLILYLFLFFFFYTLSAASFPVPPLIRGAEARLIIQKGQLELPWGTSDTLGYNRNYLGPTLIFERGDLVDITVQNSLSEDTTLH